MYNFNFTKYESVEKFMVNLSDANTNIFDGFPTSAHLSRMIARRTSMNLTRLSRK